MFKLAARLLPLLLLLAAGAKAQDVTVSLDIDDDPLFVGDELVLSILIDNGNDGTLTGAGVALAFNPDLLQLAGVELNPGIGGLLASSTGTIDNDNGTVGTIGFAAFFGGPSGLFPLAELTFNAVGEGISELTLTESILDEDGLPTFQWGSSGTASGSNEPDLTFVSDEVQVVVPLPAAAVLFLSGLLGLLAFKGRGRNAASV